MPTSHFDSIAKVHWGDAKKELHQGKHITASFTCDEIVVYQAYNEKIASYAVQNQTF